MDFAVLQARVPWDWRATYLGGQNIQILDMVENPRHVGLATVPPISTCSFVRPSFRSTAQTSYPRNFLTTKFCCISLLWLCTWTQVWFLRRCIKWKINIEIKETSGPWPTVRLRAPRLYPLFFGRALRRWGRTVGQPSTAAAVPLRSGNIGFFFLSKILSKRKPFLFGNRLMFLKKNKIYAILLIF